jgi:hypothetical protein
MIKFNAILTLRLIDREKMKSLIKYYKHFKCWTSFIDRDCISLLGVCVSQNDNFLWKYLSVGFTSL